MGGGEVKNHFDEDRGKQPELSEQEIREKLLKEYKDKYGLEFIDPDPDILKQIPLEFNYDNFKSLGIKTDILEAAIKEATNFLRMPMIKDNFGNDHDKRRKWLTLINKQYGDNTKKIFENNRLKLNSLGSLKTYLYLLSKSDGSNQAKIFVDRVKELYNSLYPEKSYHKKYRELSQKEKEEFIDKVILNIIDFLNFIKDYQNQESNQ